MADESRIRRGTRHPAAKLTPFQVLMIRQMYDADVPLSRIRKELSLTVCRERIRQVGLRKTYLDVPEREPSENRRALSRKK